MKAAHLPPRADNSRPHSDHLPPTPTSLYNYKLSPTIPDTPPPLPPPHANLSPSQQETWNRLNSNSNPANMYHSLPTSPNRYVAEQSDFRFTSPSPFPRTGNSSNGSHGPEQTWEQQHGLHTPLTPQHNGYRQSAPSGYLPRQQKYEVRGTLPSERHDRRSFVMPNERRPQIPKVPAHQYVPPSLDRYQIREPQSPALHHPPRNSHIASLPKIPQTEASVIERKLRKSTLQCIYTM